MSVSVPYKVIAIGTSAGGIDALVYLLPQIRSTNLAVLIVQHIHPNTDTFFLKSLNEKCRLKVREACSTEIVKPGIIYFAPPDYHMQVESDCSISLSMDEKVNFSRPSIDVLFDTAASAFKSKLTGILLTGANSDGSRGLKHIHDLGGYTIVQQPESALFGEMPASALKLFTPDLVLNLSEIAEYLSKLI